MSWYVVTMTTDACQQDPSTRCIMDVIGPFESHEDAHVEQRRVPLGLNPHLIIGMSPQEWKGE